MPATEEAPAEAEAAVDMAVGVQLLFGAAVAVAAWNWPAGEEQGSALARSIVRRECHWLSVHTERVVIRQSLGACVPLPMCVAPARLAGSTGWLSSGWASRRVAWRLEGRSLLATRVRLVGEHT